MLAILTHTHTMMHKHIWADENDDDNAFWWANSFECTIETTRPTSVCCIREIIKRNAPNSTQQTHCFTCFWSLQFVRVWFGCFSIALASYLYHSTWVSSAGLPSLPMISVACSRVEWHLSEMLSRSGSCLSSCTTGGEIPATIRQWGGMLWWEKKSHLETSVLTVTPIRACNGLVCRNYY